MAEAVHQLLRARPRRRGQGAGEVAKVVQMDLLQIEDTAHAGPLALPGGDAERTTPGTDEHGGVRLRWRPLDEVGLDLGHHGRGQHQRAATGDGPSWWDEALPNQLPEAALANGTSFDAIVVDEGQDFSPDWWLHLQLLLRDPDDGGFYVFADAEQSIYRDGWQPPFEGMEFDLTTNCRNTVPIASLVASLYDREVDTLGALGPDPSFTPINRMGETKDAVRKVLYRLMHEGKVPADEVAVLSSETSDSAREGTAT